MLGTDADFTANPSCRSPPACSHRASRRRSTCEGDAVRSGLEGPQPSPHGPGGAVDSSRNQKRRRHRPASGSPGSVRRLPLCGVGPDEGGQGLGRASFASAKRRTAQNRSATPLASKRSSQSSGCLVKNLAGANSGEPQRNSRLRPTSLAKEVGAKPVRDDPSRVAVPLHESA